jgi:hypothetical protein
MVATSDLDVAARLRYPGDFPQKVLSEACSGDVALASPDASLAQGEPMTESVVCESCIS